MDVVKPNHALSMGNEASRSISDSVSLRNVSGFSMNDDEDDVYDGHSSAVASQSMHSRIDMDEIESDPDDEHGIFNNRAAKRVRSGMSARTAISASVDNWLGSTVAHSSSRQRCPTDGKTILDGFDLASLEVALPHMPFDTPLAPKGFKAGHVFSDTVTVTTGSMSDRRRRGEGGAVASAALLNGSIDTKGKSIFDLVGDQAKKQIQSAIDARNSNSDLPPTSTASLGNSSNTSRPMLTSDAVLKSNFAGLSQAFQNRFVSSSSATPADATAPSAGLTTAKEHAIAVQALPSISISASVSEKAKLDSESNSRRVPTAGSTASFLSHTVSHGQIVSQRQGQGQDLISSTAVGHGHNSSRGASSASLPLSKGAASPSSSGSSAAKDSDELRGSARRTSREWHPVPLLSRRFHIKVEGLTAGMANGRQNQSMKATPIVDSKLDSMFAGLRESDPAAPRDLDNRESAGSGLIGEVIVEREEEEVVVKPPMSLFKSIFEDSDSDSDSSSDEDYDEGEDEDKKEMVQEMNSKVGMKKQTSNDTQQLGSARTDLTLTEKIPDKSPSSFLRIKFGNLSEKSQSLLPQEENSRVSRKVSDPASGVILPVIPESSEMEIADKVEEEVRVVFRKPSSKARVNAFSSKAKPKAKRTFSTLEEDGDEDTRGIDADAEDNGEGGVPEARAVTVSSKRGRKYISRGMDDFSPEAETSRLIKEMQEGVKEEEERDAANAQAVGSFFSNMVDNSNPNMACVISDAVAAANDIIAAAEAEAEVEAEVEADVEVAMIEGGYGDGNVGGNRGGNRGGNEGETGALEGTVESRIVSEWYSRSAQRLQEVPQGRDRGQVGGQNKDEDGPVDGSFRQSEIGRNEENLGDESDTENRRERKEKRKKEKKKKEKKHSQRKSMKDSDDDKKSKVKRSKKSKDKTESKSTSKSSKKDSKHSSMIQRPDSHASSSSDSGERSGSE
jgi:hypothetical protein